LLLLQKIKSMEIIRSTEEIKRISQSLQRQNKSIGFVPTMGALHEGHLTLVRRSVKENAVTVVSIFVNPIQFNNPEDLEKYPQQQEQDFALLKQENVDYVFVPDEAEMYPEGKPSEQYDFGLLDKVLEGAFRPGHFNGVAIVVRRLFDIVQPQKAYFGEKDFQQLKIIQSLVKQLNMPVSIIPVPIVRETDGLAMSSRNLRLTPEHRKEASLIYETLQESTQLFGKKTIAEIKEFVVSAINANPLFEVEYFEIVNADTLETIQHHNDAENCLGAIAVFAGKIRLIDNICYTNK